MLDVIITSIVSFISTNIDDIFLLMLLYAQTGRKQERLWILVGRYIGTGLLLAVSFLGVFGLSFISDQLIRLLGIIPILLGIKAWAEYREERKAGNIEELKQSEELENAGESADREKRQAGALKNILTAVLLTISSGADNIGVYIPVFAGYSGSQIVVVVIVFAVMTAVWSFFGERLSDLPLIKEKINQYKGLAVAIIFIILGAFILLGIA